MVFEKKFSLNGVVFSESNAIFGVNIFENSTNDWAAPSSEGDGVEFVILVGLRSAGRNKLEKTVNECRRIIIAMQQIGEMSKDLIVESGVRGREVNIFEIHGSVRFHRERLGHSGLFYE